MTSSRTIGVWTENISDVRAALPNRLGGPTVAAVARDVLATNLREFLADFEGIVQEEGDSQFVVDELELNLAVNASGGIELIGKFSSGIVASLKVTLKRRRANL